MREDREAVLVWTIMVLLSWKAVSSCGTVSGADQERTEVEAVVATLQSHLLYSSCPLEAPGWRYSRGNSV